MTYYFLIISYYNVILSVIMSVCKKQKINKRETGVFHHVYRVDDGGVGNLQ